MAKQWFVSHPSGGRQHTPVFFSAVDRFAREHSSVSIVFPHDKAEEVQQTKDALEQSDLVLVEVSLPSTGSGVEMGWANAAGKPIIAFHQGGTEPSPALKFVTKEIKTYVTAEDIVEALGTYL